MALQQALGHHEAQLDIGIATQRSIRGFVRASRIGDGDASVCHDQDIDTCDDCSVITPANPNNDGMDTDSDSQCDAGDVDDDDDGFAGGADCAPTDDQAWAVPDLVTDLTLTHVGGIGGTTTLSWGALGSLGGTAVAYDTISSLMPDDFTGVGTCVESDDGSDTAATPILDHALGQVNGKAGHPEKTRAALDALTAMPGADPLTLVPLHAALGNKEKVLEALERSYEAKSVFTVWLRVVPRLYGAWIESEPRYRRILAEMNYPPV